MGTTKKFKWVDRDTAARDVLQLVYFAPHRISTLALRLLAALGSTAILYELDEIAHDSSRSQHERRVAQHTITRIFERINNPPALHKPDSISPSALPSLPKHDISYQQSPIYIKLETLYAWAMHDDRAAYSALVRQAAYERDQHLAIRALATIFLGALYPQYDPTNDLAHILIHTYNDDDGSLDPYSIIRTQAGAALYRIATPRAWEALIDGYFVAPRDILLGFMDGWISGITNELSGIPMRGIHEKASITLPIFIPWAKILANIDIKETGLDTL